MSVKKISLNDIEHLAKLAGLALSKKEQTTFARQIGEIVSYMEILSKADISDLEPVSQVTGKKNVFRKDKNGMPISSKDALSNASSHEDGYFKTGLIIKKDGS